MQVCQSLATKLEKFGDAFGLTQDELWRQVLYEVPDDALEAYHMIQTAGNVEVSEETEALTKSLADAFGMTVLGLSVLMDKIIDKAMSCQTKMVDYERQLKLQLEQES